MPTIDTQLITPGVICVTLPLPFALRSVNCYLVHGPHGWALLDAGLNWPPAQAAWHAALDQHGLHFTDIVAIYITHYHPDHVGLAGWWQQQSGAPVFMTPYEASMVDRAWAHPERDDAELQALFVRHAVPSHLVATALNDIKPTNTMVTPLPEITVLDTHHGSTLDVAGYPMTALVLPGHAEEQLCFYDAARRTLFSVDHVLGKITPNISVFPGTLPNPLGRYLESFDQLVPLDVDTVLPGHGASFGDLPKRLDQLRAHHADRLDQMVAALDAGATAFDICMRVFALEGLESYQVQFALGETLAHLELLEVQGRVVCEEGDVVRYRQS